MLRDHWEFLRQFLRRFHTTGAIAPSSPFLARALTRSLAARRRPARVLEVGPGTGAVTRHIVRLLGPHDRLDLVELNDSFVEFLRGRFQNDPEYRRVASQCQVHACGIHEFETPEPYDFVISGLPLNNFSPSFVEGVMERFLYLMAPGGELSYFEYMFVRSLRTRLSRGDERQRLAGLTAVLERYLERYRVGRDWIFPNLPPAWVQHLRKP